MVYKSGQIFLRFCHNTRVWQTDGQTDGRTDGRTDGQTDRILITIPRLHYMQRGKNDDYYVLLLAIISAKQSGAHFITRNPRSFSSGVTWRFDEVKRLDHRRASLDTSGCWRSTSRNAVILTPLYWKSSTSNNSASLASHDKQMRTVTTRSFHYAAPPLEGWCGPNQ